MNELLKGTIKVSYAFYFYDKVHNLVYDQEFHECNVLASYDDLLKKQRQIIDNLKVIGDFEPIPYEKYIKHYKAKRKFSFVD